MNSKLGAQMKLINVFGGRVRSHGICPITEACMEEAALEVRVRGQVHSKLYLADAGNSTALCPETHMP